ncbi:MAG: cation transporter [Planctomyces sp.]|nr:cation transporter [Planctomyces sp.]
MHSHGPSCAGDHHARHEHAGGRVGWALALTLVLMLGEFAGGWWTNSLALIADAGHMLSDALALAATWYALRRIRRPPTPRRTFGERRAETLAALFNGALLLVVAGGILHEAADRIRDPQTILAGPMLLIATAGLAVNLAGLYLLHDHRHDSLGLEGAWQHVASDAAGSVCAMLAALGAWWGGWMALDAVASLAVAGLIIVGAVRLLRRTIAVLMEHAPEGVDVVQVREALLSTPGVQGVHCLHVWTIASGFRALTAHVVHAEGESPAELLDRLHARLGEEFPVEHVTLQLEAPDYAGCPGAQGWCETGLDPGGFAAAHVHTGNEDH